MSAERSLWAAVVYQAFADAFAPSFGTTDIERRHALRFLLSEDAKWTARRDEVGSYIGTDGELIRVHAQRVLSGTVTFTFNANGRRFDLERARSLVALERARPKPKITRPHLARPAPEEPPMRMVPNYPSIEGFWLCFQVREDGTLLLPKNKGLVGSHDGLPLPNGCSFQAKVMRALTQPYGASLIALRKATPNWLKVAKDLCHLYDLEVVLKDGPFDVAGTIDDLDAEKKAYLRRRLPHAA